MCALQSSLDLLTRSCQYIFGLTVFPFAQSFEPQGRNIARSVVDNERRHSMLLLFPARCPWLTRDDGVDDVSPMGLCTKQLTHPLPCLANSSTLPSPWRQQQQPLSTHPQRTPRRCQKLSSSACSKLLPPKKRNSTKNVVSTCTFIVEEPAEH